MSDYMQCVDKLFELCTNVNNTFVADGKPYNIWINGANGEMAVSCVVSLEAAKWVEQAMPHSTKIHYSNQTPVSNWIFVCE